MTCEISPQKSSFKVKALLRDNITIIIPWFTWMSRWKLGSMVIGSVGYNPKEYPISRWNNPWQSDHHWKLPGWDIRTVRHFRVIPQLPMDLSRWWLNQPVWKICSSNWIIPQGSGWNSKNMSFPPSMSKKKQHLSCHYRDFLLKIEIFQPGMLVSQRVNSQICRVPWLPMIYEIPPNRSTPWLYP